jgi:hypothetical protein
MASWRHQHHHRVSASKESIKRNVFFFFFFFFFFFNTADSQWNNGRPEEPEMRLFALPPFHGF